ncbi:hypothetical protein ACQ4WX_48440 [Streptomyces lasalocidi]
MTYRVETFTPTGRRLESGTELPADIVVTATGLQSLVFGGMPLTVDGREGIAARHHGRRRLRPVHVLRALGQFPTAGSRAPRRLDMGCVHGVVTLRHGRVDDGTIRFSTRRADAGPTSQAGQRHDCGRPGCDRPHRRISPEHRLIFPRQGANQPMTKPHADVEQRQVDLRDSKASAAALDGAAVVCGTWLTLARRG